MGPEESGIPQLGAETQKKPEGSQDLKAAMHEAVQKLEDKNASEFNGRLLAAFGEGDQKFLMFAHPTKQGLIEGGEIGYLVVTPLGYSSVICPETKGGNIKRNIEVAQGNVEAKRAIDDYGNPPAKDAIESLIRLNVGQTKIDMENDRKKAEEENRKKIQTHLDINQELDQPLS